MIKPVVVMEVYPNLPVGVIEVKLRLVEHVVRAYCDHLKVNGLDAELVEGVNVRYGVLVNITPIAADDPDPDFTEYDNAMTVIMGSWWKSVREARDGDEGDA